MRVPIRSDGHEVGRELDPLEAAAEHVARGLDGHRLGEAGNALQQDVAVGQERDEHALEHLLLPDDHALDLEQGRLERAADLFGASHGVKAPLLGVDGH